MGKGGWGHRWVERGGLQKETPLLAWCRMVSGFAGEGGRVGDKELLGRWPGSPQRGSPAPPFLPQLGQSCAPAQQPGSARARELLPSES